MNYRMYCIFSKESLERMKGIRGKMASQAGHAFLHAYWDSLEKFKIEADIYKSSGRATKITCVVDTDAELLNLYEKYQNVCGTTKVIDSGDTVFGGVPTLTCIGLGPIDIEQHGKIEAKLLT